MAINYTTKMEELGKLVKFVNSFAVLEDTTLPADLAEILTQYGTANTGTTNTQNMVSGLTDAFTNLGGAVGSMRTTLAGYATPTLTDYDTVVSQLVGLASQDISSTLLAIYQDMLDNSQTVVRSVVTLGTVTAASGNIGNGTILLDKQLDGYNSPIAGGLTNPRYVGVDSELAPAPSTAHAFICTGDSYGASGGTTVAGGETFSWSDGVAFSPFSQYPEGAGAGPGLTAAGGNSATANGFFSTFSNNVPSGWTLVGGVAGTNVLQDTSVVFGTNTSSLKFQGANNVATIAVSADASPGILTPRRRYCVSFYAKRTGPGTSGVLTAGFTGTGYFQAPEEQITVGTIPLVWTLYSFFITAPAALPEDFAFQLAITHTLDNSTYINLANVFVVPVTYFSGFSATPIGGSVPFAALDKFTATVSNDGAGLFQEFFRVLYAFQLPSLPSSTSGAYSLLPPFYLFTGAGGSTATIPNAYCV